MDIFLTILLGLALSLDSFSISLVISLISKKKHFKLPILFGIMHIIMILIGYLISLAFINKISSFDHWFVFGILTILGIKMIMERNEKYKEKDWNSWKNSILISIAGSMDALALGITFNILNQSLFYSSLVIGLIIILTSYIALIFGKKLQFLKPKYNYIIGGFALILIGLKILLEHIL